MISKVSDHPMGRHLCGLYYDYTGEGGCPAITGRGSETWCRWSIGNNLRRGTLSRGQMRRGFQGPAIAQRRPHALVTLGLFYALDESTEEPSRAHTR